jgi:hypothetical protein
LIPISGLSGLYGGLSENHVTSHSLAEIQTACIASGCFCGYVTALPSSDKANLNLGDWDSRSGE